MNTLRVSLLALVFLGLSFSGTCQCIRGNCENGFGTYSIHDGKYIGMFKDGKPSGHGTFIKDDTKYEGTWNGWKTETHFFHQGKITLRKELRHEYKLFLMFQEKYIEKRDELDKHSENVCTSKCIKRCNIEVDFYRRLSIIYKNACNSFSDMNSCGRDLPTGLLDLDHKYGFELRASLSIHRGCYFLPGDMLDRKISRVVKFTWQDLYRYHFYNSLRDNAFYLADNKEENKVEDPLKKYFFLKNGVWHYKFN